ncbi:small ribosomal subunit protein mS33 [Linepithema humile]|uniref:small ribosomal subunit protein mS33 n=1 Tax=Linepithema humile TaxID=83485 RepID=UPI0006232DDC|nr:PREDICTED: 28S ribosomal protein S33, mitochondrial [Linepithema humile]XP_012221276.1 PREDICTED: 28S ribosomal protein S33, mitochondrial [Linepithema humile]
MSKYVNLMNIGTNYAIRMNRLSNRIFGEVVRSTNNKSMKIMKLFSERPVNKRPEIVQYYPRYEQTDKLMTYLRDYGLFRDEHKDFKEEYTRLRALRGKTRWIAPPFRNKDNSSPNSS